VSKTKKEEKTGGESSTTREDKCEETQASNRRTHPTYDITRDTARGKCGFRSFCGCIQYGRSLTNLYISAACTYMCTLMLVYVIAA